MSVIELNDVSVTFHEGGRTVEAVKHVNISVEKGEIFGIVGFSGAGKSTLVRTINLLERPTGGHVVIDGSDITALKGGQLRDLRKKIGFIFQGFNLITNVTVGKNIEFALKAGGYPKAQWSARIRELLALVGLENKIDSYPSSLSGGQKQRVSIARALANKPEILLCDEATSALDLETTEGILALLQRINRELGITIVFITHQLDVAKQIFDRVAVMENGVVVEQGNTFDVFSTPKHPTTKRWWNAIWHCGAAAAGAVAAGRHHRGTAIQGGCGTRTAHQPGRAGLRREHRRAACECGIFRFAGHRHSDCARFWRGGAAGAGVEYVENACVQLSGT